MKKQHWYAGLIILMIVFNACNKGKNPNTPTPPPNPPPAESKMIIPNKQMRATWIATVWGLDWPMSIYAQAAQKQQYINYLEKFKQLNMNAVFVQIKGMGDAFYNSPYEPWSGNITGVRGQNPGYDVLKFMIDEAHARGLEFHAWLNPYRIGTRAGSATPYPPLHSSIKPEWVISHEKIQIYNPAVPGVRQRLVDIVKDIITKYEVDGIHMDDYFYPDPSSAGQMVPDQPDFVKYGSGYSNIEDFRRGNVNQAIKAVHDMIVATKPAVVFSISPTQNPDYNFGTLFADVDKWAREGWMDVVIPQLYTHSVFQSRLNTWDKYNNKPPLMVGHGFYQMNNGSELTTQFSLTKNKKAVVGNLLYSAKYLNEKPELTAALANIFSNPAVIPFLGRATAPTPAPPTGLRIEGNTLKWAKSGNARSVVYFTPDLKQEAKVLAITQDAEAAATSPGFYTVSAINADNRESSIPEHVKK